MIYEKTNENLSILIKKLFEDKDLADEFSECKTLDEFYDFCTGVQDGYTKEELRDVLDMLGNTDWKNLEKNINNIGDGDLDLIAGGFGGTQKIASGLLGFLSLFSASFFMSANAADISAPIKVASNDLTEKSKSQRLSPKVSKILKYLAAAAGAAAVIGTTVYFARRALAPNTGLPSDAKNKNQTHEATGNQVRNDIIDGKINSAIVNNDSNNIKNTNDLDFKGSEPETSDTKVVSSDKSKKSTKVYKPKTSDTKVVSGDKSKKATKVSGRSKKTIDGGKPNYVKKGYKNNMGLSNPGNACYINATLQQLYNIAEFRIKVMNDTSGDTKIEAMKTIFNSLDEGKPLEDDVRDWALSALGYDGSQEAVRDFLTGNEYIGDVLDKLDFSVDTHSLNPGPDGYGSVRKYFSDGDNFIDSKLIEKDQVIIPFSHRPCDVGRKNFGVSKEVEAFGVKRYLTGAVVKSGDVDSGHYVSYKKTADGKWYRYSDSWVEEKSEADMNKEVSEEGCLLVYSS